MHSVLEKLWTLEPPTELPKATLRLTWALIHFNGSSLLVSGVDAGGSGKTTQGRLAEKLNQAHNERWNNCCLVFWHLNMSIC